MKRWKILCVSDNYITAEHFQSGFNELSKDHDVRIIQLDIGRKSKFITESEKSLSEYRGSPEQLIEEVGDSEILVVHVAPVTREVIESGKNLKLIACARGGPVNIDVKAAYEMNIPVINAPGRNANAVAELVIGLLIALCRRIVISYNNLKNFGLWRLESYEGIELTGKRLGLIGLGHIGYLIAQKAKALGMDVVAYDPYVSKDRVPPDIKLVDLRSLLITSDFVSVHARLTGETEGMIGEKELELMKPTAYLINTARGPIINEKALYRALKDGKIAGAALDVFKEEPLKPDNPLLKLDNVILTPHIGGFTREVRLNSIKIISDDIERFIRGENPINIYRIPIIE